MKFCTQCGKELGSGRFCSACGHPAVAVEPPPAQALPHARPRYPLFADEVGGEVGGGSGGSGESAPSAWSGPSAGSAQSAQSAPGGGASPAPATSALPFFGEPAAAQTAERAAVPDDAPAGRGATFWSAALIGVGFLVVIILIGVWLLTGGSRAGGGQTGDDAASRSSQPRSATADGQDGKTGEGSADATTRDDVRDLSGTATASAPSTARSSSDTAGNITTFAAGNMLDGDPTTAWRMGGDGTGRVLTFELADPATLTRVGLVNGYAKTGDEGGHTIDWYSGNRRIRVAEWVFDDGTTVRQDLKDTRRLQTIDIDPVETSTVRLRLVEVTGPGKGRAARDNTPVSEVALVGR